MIYCVVPEALADELYPKLAKYYEDDPNVKVIIDRRSSDRRAGEDRRAPERKDAEEPLADVLPMDGRREQRDRRRSRIPGEFPRVDPEETVKVPVHVDGGSRGNRGPAAAAAVISSAEGEVLDEAMEVLG